MLSLNVLLQLYNADEVFLCLGSANPMLETSVEEELDEDIAVTQSQTNFTCPLTQVFACEINTFINVELCFLISIVIIFVRSFRLSQVEQKTVVLVLTG